MSGEAQPQSSLPVPLALLHSQDHVLHQRHRPAGEHEAVSEGVSPLHPVEAGVHCDLGAVGLWVEAQGSQALSVAGVGGGCLEV